jgi:hypothetical protein
MDNWTGGPTPRLSPDQLAEFGFAGASLCSLTGNHNASCTRCRTHLKRGSAKLPTTAPNDASDRELVGGIASMGPVRDTSCADQGKPKAGTVTNIGVPGLTNAATSQSRATSTSIPDSIKSTR